MKPAFSIFPLLFLAIHTHAQVAPDSAQTRRDSFATFDDLRAKQVEHDIEQLTYIDSTFRFKVAIPDWFNLIDTGSPYFWGGTLPAVDSIENAIAIKSSPKDGQATFQDFENFVVGKWGFGGHPNWSDNFVCMGIKELEEFAGLGKSYKVYLMNGALLYHCQYVLIETPAAFLWVDFTATQTTFEANKGKFDEFMGGFEVMKE